MPLTEKGEKILHSMQEQNGAKAGESEFYASKNAGTISGVDSVPIGRGYDAEPLSSQAMKAVRKTEIEPGRGVSRPPETLNSQAMKAVRKPEKDEIPLGKCYQDDVPPAVMSGDPVISPTSTSQYSGMQEQLRTAPQPGPGPVEPVDGADASKSIKGKQEQLFQESLKHAGNHTSTQKMPERNQESYKHSPNESFQGSHSEAHHDPKNGRFDAPPLSDLDAFARLGAGGDAWSKMTGRHDFSGDGNSSMGKLPEQVGFGEIKRMGAGFNYNQGYGGNPYKK